MIPFLLFFCILVSKELCHMTNEWTVLMYLHDKDQKTKAEEEIIHIV